MPAGRAALPRSERKTRPDRRTPMKRILALALLVLPLLCSGCIIYDRDGGYYHHEHWHDRW
jgi:hypothetical protein